VRNLRQPSHLPPIHSIQGIVLFCCCRGCLALGYLAENHPANAAAAREAGCVQLVAAAMRPHKYDHTYDWLGQVMEVLQDLHYLGF
jgi:hypothetical protein